MKFATGSIESLLLVILLSLSRLRESKGTPCPFGLKAHEDALLPQDDIHKNVMSRSGLRRRITALSDKPDTKVRLMKIIENRADNRRVLQGSCLSSETYDDIDDDIASLNDAFGTDNVSRAHFLGGIVRLAAHDFMDYDKDNLPHMGPDGCIDMLHPANTGLPEDIWCDTCDLTRVYEANYSHISKADFWIISANSVIRQTSSNNELDLKSSFVWGRTDADACPDSAIRLPESSSCTEVEDVFLTRLGLTWTDAVALLGAHTLGRGNADFSGHHGIWVDTDEESIKFDKQYFEEIFRRAWRPRNDGSDNQDWTWGGGNGNSPRFMLNTDMCLFFDLESNYPCCLRNDLLDGDGGNRCVDEALSQNPCLPYGETHRRKEAADAVEAFALGGGRGFNNDINGPFYTAFAKAWANATTNGWNRTSLQPLSESCSPAPPPTTSPTNLSTTSSPTSSPTQPPTVTSSSPPPTPSCTDIDSFTDGNGRLRTCSFVVDGRNRCGQFAHLCPVTCGECDCLLTRRVCNSNNDRCSGVCGLDGLCACRPRNAVCESDKECCSGQCSSGSCAGRSRLFG